MRTVGCAIAALVLWTGGCSRHGPYLRPEPAEVEGQFLRACELLEEVQRKAPKPRLRTQIETMAALSSIRPPGRVCFLCKRLRQCASRLELAELKPVVNARILVRETIRASRPGIEAGQRDFPPEGAPLAELLAAACRTCAAMPPRIQKGTW